MEYRREIDGLRALAVLPVILFHAGFETFRGGYVGVDVFFVISGYLITSIVLADLERGRFSLAEFYERRARRILPALFVVTLACVPPAVLLLLPTDRDGFFQSLIAVPLFASNVLFWLESGYFDTAAELKPLLHTWSLAVEEQFYVLFPLALLLAWPLGLRWLWGLLILVAGASLVYSQWAAFAQPAAAFFLLPFRIWELLLGALAALWVSSRGPVVAGRWLRELAAGLGVGLIAWAVLTFDEKTMFPGLSALVPTLGALLVILFASQATLLGRVIGNRFFVAIGLLSYSAYLWHQPLFAFARHAGLGVSGGVVFAILSVASIVLAYPTWRFIERPIRRRERFQRRQILVYALTASALTMSIGLAGLMAPLPGEPVRGQQPDLSAFASYDSATEYREGSCFLKRTQSYESFASSCQAGRTPPRVLVWGDSHAAAMTSGLLRTNSSVAQYTASACPPYLGVEVDGSPMCRDINTHVADRVRATRPETIVLHANWTLYEKHHPVAQIEPTIEWIRAVTPDSRIVLVGGIPQYYPSLPAVMRAEGVELVEGAALDTNYMYERLRWLDGEFEQIAKRHDIEVHSALSTFCQQSHCRVTAAIDGVLMPMAWDYGHLTAAGSLFLAEDISVLRQADGNPDAGQQRRRPDGQSSSELP